MSDLPLYPPRVTLHWNGWRADLLELQRCGWEVFGQDDPSSYRSHFAFRYKNEVYGRSSQVDKSAIQNLIRSSTSIPLTLGMEFLSPPRAIAYRSLEPVIPHVHHWQDNMSWGRLGKSHSHTVAMQAGYYPIDVERVDYQQVWFEELLPLHPHSQGELMEVSEREPTVMELLERIKKMQEPERLARVKKAMREQPTIITPHAHIVSITGERLT